MARSRNTFRHIFAVPLLLVLLSAGGLLSALLGDGVWDALSWFALSLPIAVPLACIVRSSRVRR